VPTVVFRLNAFIPRTVVGYTRLLLAGPHTGKTAIPLPKIARLWPGNLFKDLDAGYLTDQRDFSCNLDASVRMQSLAEVEVSTLVLLRQVHRSSGTTEVNLVTGKQTGFKVANMSRCRFESSPTRATPGHPGRYGTVQIRLVAAGGDPLVGMAADIDYEGTFSISGGNSPGSLTVGFKGKIDAFTGFECYASFNSLTKELFRSSPPSGNTVVNLLGPANRPITGGASFPR
jgi:hypothetical protein